MGNGMRRRKKTGRQKSVTQSKMNTVVRPAATTKGQSASFINVGVSLLNLGPLNAGTDQCERRRIRGLG